MGRYNGPRGRAALRTALLVAGGGLALAVPLVRGGYVLYVGTEALIWGIAAAGLGVLVGYGGLVSLGHAAFFGLGAYTTALLSLRAAVPWAVAVALAVVAACAYAALIGPLVLRSHGIFFVMLTLAFGQLLYAGAEQWVSLTRGSDGISGIPQPGFFRQPPVAYLMATAVALGVQAALGRVVRSPFGRALDALRQDEAKARALGYSAFWYRYAAFVGSAGVTALAGALYAYHRAFVSPEDLRWTHVWGSAGHGAPGRSPGHVGVACGVGRLRPASGLDQLHDPALATDRGCLVDPGRSCRAPGPLEPGGGVVGRYRWRS